MSNQTSHSHLPVEEALKILKEHSCTQIKPVESEEEREQLRQAILLIASWSEYENLGICADSAGQGLATLSSYLKALGYEADLDNKIFPKTPNPVYIKFNTQKQSYYLDSYPGSYRGVLISYQTENDHLVGTYGHFPLDLFDV